MRIIFIVCFLMSVLTTQAQISNQGIPVSWSITKKQQVAPIYMPSFDLRKVQAEDRINDRYSTKAWRFGYEFSVDIGLGNAGKWEELPNGDRLWRVLIVSNGAKTLNFVFDRYKLPEGATVYLYNDERTFKLGAYTSLMNNENESLGTWLADGGRVWIEYYEPAEVRGEGKLHLGTVVHGYRSVANYKRTQKALNDSGDCNLDVNCSVGEDFDTLKEQLKKSVGIVIVGSNGFCTGALVNNTNNDNAPYFLTANHCEGNVVNWAFRFNWVSQNTVCASTDDSIDNGEEEYYQTTSGARELASNVASDFKLLEIKGGLDKAWDLEWAGWDRTDNMPSYVVSIHHPNGDIMKVCRDDSGVIKAINNGAAVEGFEAETWEITAEGNGWELGVTEGGSSGGPLFNEEGLLIGQLYGGDAACRFDETTVDNNLKDFYGRFAVSWNEGMTRETRLSDWLDPTGTGVEKLKMLSEAIKKGEENEGGIVLYPIPASDIVNVANLGTQRFFYEIFGINGQRVKKGVVNSLEQSVDISSLSNGVYFMLLKETENAALAISKKLVVRKEKA
ncbi:T9SS type A sorting domain-containing protein [Aquimarina hainanensis]|uniref:T9SS type A sorting domain-containing protein n=1 Tax=Aquimarina hainanensis TaxID=1578017 RepID=A0ABW5N5S0_9FLAO